MLGWLNKETKSREEVINHALTLAENQSTFPIEIPEIGQKVKLIYFDNSDGNPDVVVFEGFVISRRYALNVKDEHALIASDCVIITISQFLFHGPWGSQEFTEVIYSKNQKIWKQRNEDKVLLTKI